MEFVSSVLRCEPALALSNLMGIPNADFLERTRGENLSARLWRLPLKSANALHRPIRAEESYFVLESENLIPAFCTS